LKRTKGYGEKFVKEELRKVTAATPAETTKARYAAVTNLQKRYFAGSAGGPGRTEHSEELRHFNAGRDLVTRRLREMSENISKVFRVYQAGVSKIATSIKSKFRGGELFTETKDPKDLTLTDLTDAGDADLTIDPEEAKKTSDYLLTNEAAQRAIGELKIIHDDLVELHVSKNRVEDIVDYLKLCRDSKAKVVKEPVKAVIKEVVDESLARVNLSDLDL